MDGALNIIKNGATQISVTVAQPTTYGTATGTYALAIKSDLTSGSYTGPADDATGILGRKLTVNEVAAQEVLVTGEANFIALCDVDDRLLYVTTCTAQTLVDGNTVTIPAWKIQIGDPT
uniref:Tail protein n=1 Tax=viral metagenome TaxID=1070528 RepID=A0A6M3LFJ0_9ZZZZ